MKRSLSILFVGICLIQWMVTLTSCANMLPPSGGPRDSLPPRLVSALPKDSSVNVKTNNITLTFDEYVTLQNIQENLIISPFLKNIPIIDYKLRNVTLKLKDSLEDNTTYSFNFGEAIRDVNENNIARDLTYVFSTGKTVDYNTYRGKVLLAENGKTDSSLLIVVLHKNLEDTAVIKEMPRYYTRLNGKGEFVFNNLPKGLFAVYVIEKGFSKKYDDSTKLFAFRNNPINIGTNTALDTLYAFNAYKPIEKKVSTTPLRAQGNNKIENRLRYSIDLENGQQDLLNNLTLTFNKKLTGFDSSKFALFDTSFHKLNDYAFTLDSSYTKIILKYKWKEYNHFRLIIAKDAVSDSLGTTLSKADTIRFSSKKEADYGSIRLRFSNLDLSKNPVLQIIQNEKLLESVPLTQNDFVRKRFRPGAYELRILYDSNKNGVWDTGKFVGSKRQPEIVYLIPKQIVIRSNWDNEVTITL